MIQRLESAGDDAIAQQGKAWTRALQTDIDRLPSMAHEAASASSASAFPLPSASTQSLSVSPFDDDASQHDAVAEVDIAAAELADLVQRVASFGAVRVSRAELCLQNTVVSGTLVPLAASSALNTSSSSSTDPASMAALTAAAASAAEGYPPTPAHHQRSGNDSGVGAGAGAFGTGAFHPLSASMLSASAAASPGLMAASASMQSLFGQQLAQRSGYAVGGGIGALQTPQQTQVW